MAARASIYDLVACLREAGVMHYLAHPLFDMTGKLTVDVVERLLLLFNVLEGRNGARVVRCNGLLRDDRRRPHARAALAAMAERQGIEPYGETPWRKALTGGSDDHSGLFIAGAHTVAPCDGTVEGFLAAVAAGECEPAGAEGDARILAHSIYAASFWRLREMLRPRRRRAAPPYRARSSARASARSAATCRSSTRRSAACATSRRASTATATGAARPGKTCSSARSAPCWRTPTASTRSDPRELNRRLFVVGQRLADDVVSLHLRPLVDPGGGLSLKLRLQKAYAVGMVHFLQLPHFIAWDIQSRDRASQERLRRHFLGDAPLAPKVAVFTDAYGDGHAAAATIRRLAESLRRRGAELTVITSSDAPAEPTDGVANFPALASRP